MKTRSVALWLALGASCFAQWRQAQLGWAYEFPRDHFAHREFKTEWWYFTGNLFARDGRRFGYELTFFRQGIRPPDAAGLAQSRWIVNDIKFAHFTVTDVNGKRFHFTEKANRGTFGEAGFSEQDRIAWIDSWQLRIAPDSRGFEISADTPEFALHLQLTDAKAAVVHGANGVSAKAADTSHASHYYSITRLTSNGEMRLKDATFAVQGDSWFDHEWATNQLAPDQIGWNWLCVQWDDGSELMLYVMRLKNGGIDPSASGTFIFPDGTSAHLLAKDFQMTARRSWPSAKTGGRYPVEWHVQIPQRQLEFDIVPAMDDQELTLGALTYWEGAIDAAGRRAGERITGHGYLELTGYTGALPGLGK